MLGAIIGDIVGSRWEFHPTNNYKFELFSNQNFFTDDTVCTVAVADALINHRDYAESIHHWCRQYPHRGYGGRFRQWVASDNPRPYKSFGNGSAMRVSPTAWIFTNAYDVLNEAKETALCTHNHPEGIKGAQVVAWAIYEGRRLHKQYAHVYQKQIAEAFKPIIKFSNYNVQLHKSDVLNRFDETCQGTVPVALWIILNSTDFEDAVRKAVCLGADADTLGAIVGSIAEAIWSIPEWMKAKAMGYLPNEMKQIVKTYYRCLERLPRLIPHCRYFHGERLCPYSDGGMRKAWEIEKEWAISLAKHYSNAKRMKDQVKKLSTMWEQWANQYQLPVSLVGCIFVHTCGNGSFMHECVGPFLAFLDKYYKVI